MRISRTPREIQILKDKVFELMMAGTYTNREMADLCKLSYTSLISYKNTFRQKQNYLRLMMTANWIATIPDDSVIHVDK